MARSRAITRTRRVYVVRRHRSRSRGGFGDKGISLAVIGGFIPGIIDSWNLGKAREATPGGLWAGFGHEMLFNYTGFNTDDHRFYPSRIFYGWGPVLAGVAVHMVANKIGLNRIIHKYIPGISL